MSIKGQQLRIHFWDFTTYTRKMVPITGRAAHSLNFLTPISIQIKFKSNPFFALLYSSVSKAYLSCVVVTIFSSLAFLSCLSTANLRCLLAFSSLSFHSNAFSSLRFNLLRVVRRSFSLSSVFSRPIHSLSFLYSSVSEALFDLIFPHLSECFFFVHAKSAQSYSRNEKHGCQGRF